MKVRFVWLKKNIDTTKNLPCPKKVEQIREWFKAARKAIPEIPINNSMPFSIRREFANEEQVVFELHTPIFPEHDKRHDFCHVVIYRKVSSLER